MVACRNPRYDMNWWFPASSHELGKGSATALSKDNLAAISICYTCEERMECLAKNFLIKFGIYGGKVKKERDTLHVMAEAAGLLIRTRYDEVGTTRIILPVAENTNYAVACSEEELVDWLYEHEAAVVYRPVGPTRPRKAKAA